MPKKMLILPGNSAPAGSYPNELGELVAWPLGALHRPAAKEYARRRGYEHDLSISPGQPQSTTSPQANDAVEFFKDQIKAQEKCAFYGFSGGGYNMYWILNRLASEHSEFLHLIELVVVLGAPKRGKEDFEASKFNKIAKKKVDPANWVDASWELVYGTNPSAKWPLPKGVPKGTDKHMFCPEWLLAGMP